MTLMVAAGSSIGKVRELNEDCYSASNPGKAGNLPEAAFPNPPVGTVLCVADGMGGTNAGEVASRTAVDAVRRYFDALAQPPVLESQAPDVLRDCILFAHASILNHAYLHPETEGMGTTLVLCWLLGGKAFVAWSGDSRCYYFRREAGLVALSKDHSYVQSLVDQGRISTEEAFSHPLGNIVTRSLGDQVVDPDPEIVSVPATLGDQFLLCSDGLTGMIPDSTIAAVLAECAGQPRQAVDTLVRKANEAGGADNITVILATVLRGRPYTGWKSLPAASRNPKGPARKGGLP